MDGPEIRIQIFIIKPEDFEMSKRRKVIMLSYYGENSVGGLEKVVYYIRIVLQNNYNMTEMKMRKNIGRWNFILYPILFSIRLKFLNKDNITIAHGWQGFLNDSDFVFFHGTTQGAITQVPQDRSLGSKYISWMEKTAAKRAGTVIAVSENCRRELIQFYKILAEKTLVLNNAVDSDVFFPKQLFKQHRKLRIAFSGTLSSRKGMDSLIALSRYLTETDAAELWIACNNNYHTKEFEGNANTYISSGLNAMKMNDFYNSCDVLYFPSRYEGFSMASLEALSAGIPIVGSSFAILDELRNYDFVQIMRDLSPAKIVQSCIEMKEKFPGLAELIHNQIKKDFGIEQYAVKLKRILHDNQNIQ